MYFLYLDADIKASDYTYIMEPGLLYNKHAKQINVVN